MGSLIGYPQKAGFDFHTADGTHFGSFVRKTADSGSEDFDNFITPMGGVGAELDQDFAISAYEFRKAYE